MLVERTFDAGGVSIRYAESGSDGPLLLMLHGVTSRWQTFLNVIPDFTQRWRVVAADLRGHGQSDHVAGKYALMEYAADVIALVRHLSEGPAVLLGHSLGAMISIGVAAEAPELVRALVLEDPPLGAFNGSPFGVRPEYTRFVATRNLVREGLSQSEVTARLAAETPGDTLGTRMRAASIVRIDPDVLTWIIESRAEVGYDLGARLSQIACPTLLLQGNPELGGALSATEAQWAASLIPDCDLVYLPEVGHGIRAADADGFSQRVVGFLEAL